MTKKTLQCIDDIYEFKEYEPGLMYGRDCAHRSLQIQAKTGLDINFGVVLCKQNLMNGLEHFKSIGGGYCMPYAWHCWNESDDSVYDSCEAFRRWGIDTSNIESVVMIEGPKVKSNKELHKYIQSVAKKMNLKGSPSVIYITGIGQNFDRLTGEFYVMDDEEYNLLLDRMDETMNITGSTENNMSKLIAVSN